MRIEQGSRLRGRPVAVHWNLPGGIGERTRRRGALEGSWRRFGGSFSQRIGVHFNRLCRRLRYRRDHEDTSPPRVISDVAALVISTDANCAAMKAETDIASHTGAPRRPRKHSGREFRIGLINAIATTIIAAVQPVITRYGAKNIDPMLFSAGSMTVAAAILAGVMWRRGEIGVLISRRWISRLVALSMAGS